MLCVGLQVQPLHLHLHLHPLMLPQRLIIKVGQNRVYTPYMTVCMVISLPKILYIHRIYLQMYGAAATSQYQSVGVT